MTSKIDSIVPKSKWQFDAEVSEVFDDMLERSIPQYDVMRETSFRLACKFVSKDSYIIDLGCSNGNALQPLIEKFGAQNKYIGIEISEPMLKIARDRFDGWTKNGIVSIKKMDLRHEFPPVPACVILSILTLMFIPLEYRQKVVSNCYNYLKNNGALILVEKVLGETADINEMYIEQYLQKKRDSGYTEEQIQRKRLSLEGVLVSMTSSWNIQMLNAAGFRYIDCFWRWYNFAGFIAVK